MAFVVVDVTDDLARATRDQRAATTGALQRGRPEEAVPPEQARARRAYLQRSRPRLLDDVVREGISGPDDMLWSSYLARGAQCLRAVGRLAWDREPQQTRAAGTGFLIAESLLVTNNHVAGTEDDAAELVLEMGYEYDSDGNECCPVELALEPDRFFITSDDPRLDYTVVAVGRTPDGVLPGEAYGTLPLIAKIGKIRNGEPLNVIHHPAGGRKKVTIRDSRLLAMEEQTLHYSGDTLGGSSGAPILNDQWEVVAVHFGGRPCRDEQRRPLTHAGEPWDDSMPESLKAYEFNVGARISRILADLRRRRPRAREKKELLAQLVQGDRS